MKMSVKKEYIILAVLIAALSGYLFWQRQAPTAYRLPTLPQLARADITRLEIDRPGQKAVYLKKAKGLWSVGAEEFPADPDKVNGMLDIVESLNLTALVSEAKSYERYELDEAHRIRVRAWAGDGLKRDLAIGKSAPTYRHTFVTVAGDPNVYHAREDFRSRFDRDLDQLRDKSVLKFKIDDIQAVTLQSGSGPALRLARPPAAAAAAEQKTKAATPPAAKWLDAAGQPADGGTVDQMLGSLATLECASYLYDQTKADLEKTKADYTVALEGDKARRLALFAPGALGAGDKQRAGISSANDYPFVLSAFLSGELAEQIDKLMGKEKPKETQTPTPNTQNKSKAQKSK